MGLRDQAAADAKTILEDLEGFGFPMTVTDPDGNSAALVGFSTDIHTDIDPDTGIIVSGRNASVALRIASLTAAGFDLPEGIPEASKRPWVVEFDDIDGVGTIWKVRDAKPDRAIGIIVLMLESYKR